MITYLYYFMVMLSFVLIYFAIAQYNKTVHILNSGVRTTATVIDLLSVRSDNNYTYKPVFEYLEGGERVNFESSISSSPPAYQVGDTVEIIYIPGTNQRKVVGFWSLYRWTIILLSIAMPFFIIGGGYILYSLK